MANITSAKYVHLDNSLIKNGGVNITYDNGETVFIFVNSQKEQNTKLEEWVADGNTIQAAE
jgi:hypothetical protein|tara:strand:- start:1923 stop:2105 length:183 start_codon:yes stop_codon:yes gene_type:complete